MPVERRAQLVIIASRALSEAVGVAVAAAVLHSLTAGRDAIRLVPASTVLFGVTLVLFAMLRDQRTTRQSAVLTVAAIGGAIGWALVQPTQHADGIAVLTRVVAFGILGEVYLWRLVGIARGLQRWRDVRNDMLFALLVIVFAALDPGAVDRDALPALGLLVVIAGGAALSLARSVEELSLGRRDIGGRAGPGASVGAAFALGAVALVAGSLLPVIQAILGDAVQAARPVVTALLVLILLPLGYLAAFVAYAFLWLRDALHLGPLLVPQPPRGPAGSDDELLEQLRALEEQRPYVVGAVEVLIAIAAVVVAIVLVGRLVAERRARVADGVEVERDAVEGIGLRATLGLLLPRRTSRAHPPADDGTNAGRLRRIYWSLLDLAERDGPGRRASAETPAEHEERLLRSGPRWRDASTVVRAFEDLRYGEVDPRDEDVEGARAALARVEAGA